MMQIKTARTASPRRRPGKLTVALLVLLPVISLLAGAAVAAMRYGAL